MKTWSLIEVIILVGLLASCDPGSITTTSIKNDTKGPLDVVLYSANQGEVKVRSLSVQSKEKIEIFFDSSLGVILQPYLQGMGIDSIRFDFPGILSITFKEGDPGKNPFNKDDWNESSTQKKLSGTKTFDATFEITDEDLNSWQEL